MNQQCAQVGVASLRDRAQSDLSPVPLCRGTRPRNAANSRPDLKVLASPIVATRAVAVSLPMPGTSEMRDMPFLFLPGANALFELIDIILERVDASHWSCRLSMIDAGSASSNSAMRCLTSASPAARPVRNVTRIRREIHGAGYLIVET